MSPIQEPTVVIIIMLKVTAGGGGGGKRKFIDVLIERGQIKSNI